jgi:hypothetical protein
MKKERRDLPDMDEFRINRLRQEASSLLQELASEESPKLRALALRRLVGAAIEACGLVMEAGKTDPDCLGALASGLTHWPVLYSVFPGEPDELEKHLRGLGLGTAAPIDLRKKWRLKAPGTRWAFAYWQLVQQVRACENLGVSAKLCGGGWVQLPLMRILLGDLEDTVALRPLSRDEAVLAEWRKAYERHLQRHFPGDSVIEHKDWKTYLAGRKLYSVGAMRGRILDEIARGFRVIARQG